jgi:hypothetical protein
MDAVRRVAHADLRRGGVMITRIIVLALEFGALVLMWSCASHL